MRTRLIAGNWKMNRTAMETEQFLGRFDAEMGKAELLICMPFTDLYLAEKYLAGTGIKWGAQNVYPAEKGAFTGEISPGMLKEQAVLMSSADIRNADRFYVNPMSL